MEIVHISTIFEKKNLFHLLTTFAIIFPTYRLSLDYVLFINLECIKYESIRGKNGYSFWNLEHTLNKNIALKIKIHSFGAYNWFYFYNLKLFSLNDSADSVMLPNIFYYYQIIQTWMLMLVLFLFTNYFFFT